MEAELCIESAEAYELATRLSELTGEDLTSVVIGALRNRLAAIQDKKQRMLVIAAEIRAHIGEPLPSSDHDWLYDSETGLPT